VDNEVEVLKERLAELEAERERERAIERIRSQVLFMRTTDDLLNVILIVY